ncbi:MAG: aminotransferase class V-fold PLP-dependent enzyme [Cyanobium sp.]
MPAALSPSESSRPALAIALREQMPALANKTYFNYGGQGPLPEASLAAITAAFRTIQELGPFSGAVWPYVSRTTEALRSRLASAAWLGVGPQRLAFTENVTAGCVLPLWGLPWQAGDQLLLSDAEHPGVVAACRELARRQQLELCLLPVADLRGDTDGPAEAEAACQRTAAAVLARLEQALTPRTRLVALSHLLWNSGQIMPITAVADRLAQHPRRPWLLVDAAQSLGAIPVAEAAAAADIYACTGHKWCCGPEGLGVVALSERLLEQASPTLIGWRSLAGEHSGSSAFHTDARRFEVATSCIPLFAGLDRSLQLLEAVGSAEQRLQAIRERSARLWHGLRQIGLRQIGLQQRDSQQHGLEPLLQVEPPAGLVSFFPGGSGPQAGRRADALVQDLGARGLWLRTLEDPHCVRACTHVFTTEAEVDQLLQAVAAWMAAPALG